MRKFADGFVKHELSPKKCASLKKVRHRRLWRLWLIWEMVHRYPVFFLAVLIFLLSTRLQDKKLLLEEAKQYIILKYYLAKSIMLKFTKSIIIAFGFRDCKTWNKMKLTFHQIIGYQCIAEVLKRFTCPQTFLVKLYWKSTSGEAALEIWFINLSL